MNNITIENIWGYKEPEKANIPSLLFYVKEIS
jgi:hypothetical protein